MKIIQKQISLDKLTSHLPSLWPAYKDGKLYYFDAESIVLRQQVYSCNYGMIPININLSVNPSSIQTADDVTIADGCLSAVPFVLSFERLSKWYHFFTEYYNLLKHYGHCGRVYTSAVDYYNYESNEKYADEMIYGSDLQTYESLDELFKERGGRVQIVTYDKDSGSVNDDTSSEDAHDEYDIINTDKTAIVDVKDKGFFKWICENVVPSFIIPYEYREYWKRETLFYPDVMQWIAWFENRRTYDKYEIISDDSQETAWNCTLADDCCECEEYFKRGASAMLDLLKEWQKNVCEHISAHNAIIQANIECFQPSAIFCLNLSSTLEDSGKKTIFSTEYSTDEDYQACRYGDSANTHSGTVATIEGHAMQLASGCGYTFDEIYMEKYLAVCNKCGYQGVFHDTCPKCSGHDISVQSWIDYTQEYIKHHPNEFCIGNDRLYYAFDSNNRKIFGNSTDENYWQKKLASYYTFTPLDAAFIEGVPYDIETSEYGVYDLANRYLGGKVYIVYRDSHTDTPYVYINGKEVYAILQSSEDSLFFYFPFFYELSPNGKRYMRYPRHLSSESNLTKYIDYHGNIYRISDMATEIAVKGKTYYIIDGYAELEDGERLYHTKNDGFFLGDRFSPYSAASLSEDSTQVSIPYSGSVKVYNAHEIKGYTYSKLDGLKIKETLTDDVGNVIDGIYQVQDTMYFQPPQGTTIDLVYQVGHAANVNAFSLTETDEDNITNGKNYFVGDIITSMKFYYKTVNGFPYDGIYVSVDLAPMSSNTDYMITLRGHDGSKADLISGVTEYMPTSLKAINLVEEYKDKYLQRNMEADGADAESVATNSEYVELDDTLYCDIRYYIGATLVRRQDTQYQLAEEGVFMHGVQYDETVAMKKEQREYYLRRAINHSSTLPIQYSSPSVHSISYPIYVYTVDQNMQDVTDTLYGNVYALPIANFSVEAYGFVENESNVISTYDKYQDMALHNNMEAFPTFGEEYEQGIAAIESIDSDIYIDRGINASLEKHLKLGEVTSLEALENYGNGYFKMMTNQ